MAKIDRGTKRLCPKCGTKYYDLGRDPIVCPHCGTVFVLETGKPNGRARPEPAKKAPVVAETTEQAPVDEAATAAGAEVISLQDAETQNDDDDDDDDDSTEKIPDVEDVEDVEDIGDDDEDTFLEEDEDDDQIGIDVNVEKDDET